MREPELERQDALDVRGVAGLEHDAHRLDIGHEVLDLAPAHDRKHIRRLLHHVRNCHYCGT